jgi:hypothetical protein
VYDYIEWCEKPENTPKAECLKHRCDLEENFDSSACNAFFDFCDARGGANWDLPQCTPPCELLDRPESDARCRDPAAAGR